MCLSATRLFPFTWFQAYFMFLGLYTLYGGIVIVYENIPACFKWVYYTNPGRWRREYCADPIPTNVKPNPQQ